MRLLVTGACGFVGSTLIPTLLEALPGLEVVGLDNFLRDGSRGNVEPLRRLGVTVVEGDIRHEADLAGIGRVDWVLDCAAEPSVLAGEIPELKPVHNDGPHGFGMAIRKGLEVFTGDAVVIMMADESDDCRDVVRYWQELNNGVDCVFGSRFMAGGGVIDYPRVKFALNRMANLFVRMLFRHGLNDTTNAFKAYRREVIEGCLPILSPHFNITVELPLKAIVRGYSWSVIPITWRNRRSGVAKLKIREMGSRYFFIVAYVWLEKYFSRGDYRKKPL